jgi:hypothetical protein
VEPIEMISTAHFKSQDKTFTLHFKQPAGAIPRHTAELELANRARMQGGLVRENTAIQKIIPATNKSPFHFTLSTGEQIEAKHAIFATGKFVQHTNVAQPLPYCGIKLHFNAIQERHTLLMFATQGAYLGIVSINETTSNSACLIKRELVEQAGSCKQVLLNWCKRNSELNAIFSQIDLDQCDWLEGKAPHFGLKKLPNWPQASFIGDAIGSLPPAIGSGFAHGISSGILAAQYYAANQTNAYTKHALQLLKPKLFIGNFLHRLLLNPQLALWALPLLRRMPWITDTLLRQIGYSGEPQTVEMPW